MRWLRLLRGIGARRWPGPLPGATPPTVPFRGRPVFRDRPPEEPRPEGRPETHR